MLEARGKIRKTIVVRPGALGDVLAARGTLRFLKDNFPAVETTLVAPGERGRFLVRDGWADRWADWERAAFSWLYADNGAPVPPALAALFARADLILAYLDDAGDGYAALTGKFARLSPGCGLVCCPSKPPAGHSEPIGEWLLEPAREFAARHCLLAADAPPAAAQAAARIRLPRSERGNRLFDGAPYAVIHPGSGGRAKNWPLERFAAAGNFLLGLADAAGKPRLAGVAIVSGEADGELGERLSRTAPGSVHVATPDLESLAGVLAGARLYLGNDSGATHLAAAVETAAGKAPAVFALFGPSDPDIWGPPGAAILRAGREMADLPVETVCRALAGELGVESRDEIT